MTSQRDNTMDRRGFLRTSGAAAGGVMIGAALTAGAKTNQETTMTRPNILFVMCDQLRADAIAALGNEHIHTPNLDRLVARGASFTRAYSTCPVCVPARYTIRTGRDPHTTTVYQNGPPDPAAGQPEAMEARCGAYLARTLASRGYRTFGIGKFHSMPWNEDLGEGELGDWALPESIPNDTWHALGAAGALWEYLGPFDRCAVPG